MHGIVLFIRSAFPKGDGVSDVLRREPLSERYEFSACSVWKPKGVVVYREAVGFDGPMDKDPPSDNDASRGFGTPMIREALVRR